MGLGGYVLVRACWGSLRDFAGVLTGGCRESVPPQIEGGQVEFPSIIAFWGTWSFEASEAARGQQ